MPVKRSHTLLLACTLALAGSHALADNTNQAEVYYYEGKASMAKREYEAACKAFANAFDLDARPLSLFNHAECREAAGQLASAHALYEQLDARTRGNSDKSAAQFNKTARERAGKLAPRLSKLIIKVAPTNQVTGLEVLRNGTRVDPATWNREVAIDGGELEITARAPRHRAWKTELTIGREADGQTVEIPILVEEAPPPPPVIVEPKKPESAPTPPERTVEPIVPPPDDKPAPVRGTASLRWPLVLGGAAIVLGAGAVGVELSGRSIYNESLTTTDRTHQLALWHQANARRYAASALAAGAVVSAGVATYLYIRVRGERRGEPVAVVAPSATADQVGFAVSGRW
jgi:tetratricopeptide (TPR) repeat protein